MFDLTRIVHPFPYSALTKVVEDAATFLAERVATINKSLPPHLLLAVAGGLLFLLTCLIGVALLRRTATLSRRWFSSKRPANRQLREAIGGKAPFAHTYRRETVIFRVGSTLSVRQRRADMF